MTLLATSQRTIDLAEMDRPHLPTVVETFKAAHEQDVLAVSAGRIQGQHFDYHDTNEPLDLPSRFDPFKPMIETALAAERAQADFQFVHITIRTAPVRQGRTQHNDQCHVDAFLENGRPATRVYVYSAGLHTEFFDTVFPFDPHKNPHEHYSEWTEMVKNVTPIQFPNQLVCLDPYTVHRSPTNPTNRQVPGPALRGFLRVGFFTNEQPPNDRPII